MRYEYEDRGDGALIVLPAEADPLPVLCVVVPALGRVSKSVRAIR